MIELSLLHEAWPAEWWDEIDSTSLEASRRTQSGQTGPVWLAAKKQLKGRGRLGRPWVSETGNLYATALIPVQKSSAELATISLTVALAVRDAVIEMTTGTIVPGLKWPNDLRVDGAKISGILLEAGQLDKSRSWISIGIGLNIRHAPDLENYKTASLTTLKSDLFVSPEQALIILDSCVRGRLKQHMISGLESVIRDWEAASDQIGALCRTTLNGAEVTGRFIGLDTSGQMILKFDNGQRISITAGDVVLLGGGAANASGD